MGGSLFALSTAMVTLHGRTPLSGYKNKFTVFSRYAVRQRMEGMKRRKMTNRSEYMQRHDDPADTNDMPILNHLL